MKRSRTSYPMQSLADENVVGKFREFSDEMLQSFAFPLFSQSETMKKDADGFPTISQENLQDLKELQKECWDKFEKNPQISSHVRDIKGRMTGWGFEFNSQIQEIQKAIEEICEDVRNDLYNNFPKYIARSEIEGELYLMLSLHKSGFVEVDFISPRMITGGGDKNSGIIFHPTKQTFPLFYNVKFDRPESHSFEKDVLIPSINIAYYPELEKDVKGRAGYSQQKLKSSKMNGAPYNKIGNYYRFIVRWDKGYMTRRNVSHIRTTLEWVNYYEALKKYEIDHKKSSGAYLWVVTIDDIKSFRTWLDMDEEDRKKTGIMETKEPGGTMVLPPGMNMQTHNPRLSPISDQDTDIMQMVSSGLQKPQDTMLGDYRSTYASVKAAQGPQSDRTNDDLAYFWRFLIYNFWRAVFYLRSTATGFKESHYIQEVVDFKDGEEVKQRVKKPSYKLVDVCFPISHLEDIEATARALLGVKHGSVVDTLGIPPSQVARRLGFSNYPTLRKQNATEQGFYPKLLSTLDQEGAQERAEAEPSKSSKQNQDGSKDQKEKRRRTT